MTYILWENIIYEGWDYKKYSSLEEVKKVIDEKTRDKDREVVKFAITEDFLYEQASPCKFARLLEEEEKSKELKQKKSKEIEILYKKNLDEMIRRKAIAKEAAIYHENNKPKSEEEEKQEFDELVELFKKAE